MPEFVHLHNHTQYSLLDGACRIKDMMRACLDNGMKSIALTDHGVMFGAIEFYKAAQAAGVKPIIGCEAYIAPRSRFEKQTTGPGMSDTSYHLVLLAKDATGYRNLMKLSSIGFLEGFYFRPRIDKEVLREHREGLICLSACLQGEISQLLLKKGYDDARAAALEYMEIFEDDFYLEVQDHGIDEEDQNRVGIYRLGKELGVPIVATNDIHYLRQDHYDAHDVLICLQTGKDYDDPKRLRYNTDQIYFKTSEEMAQLFVDHPEVIENTLAVEEKCNLELDFSGYKLPHFQLPEGAPALSLSEYLARKAREGLAKRYEKVTPELEQRLAHELQVIGQMGFDGYFLIVSDFIEHARSKDIPVGPGRGSAAGSLVSYALGITNIDPMQYNLIFERFLNPERVTMPDIDIDFCYNRREEIIEYVRHKYGNNNVTQIITFGTMAARAVIRDVGRVLKLNFGEVDRIAKLIPATLGITLDEAIKSVSELKQMEQGTETQQKLLDYARTLEGLARHASTHAAGVVITPDDLTNHVPLYRSSKTDVTTQYDMKCVEEIGLLKMDFLGLRTLTVIDDTVRMIREQDPDFDIEAIPMNDPETYRVFGEGRTVAIFQFESSGMREYLKKLRPTCLEDLIAMNSLYRPGPMDMIDDFIDRKHGRKKIEYLHPLLEPILKETYGIIVYQEQVMQIASQLGGFTLGGADNLRRAMGKKKVELMVEQRALFLAGAAERNIPEAVANEIFDLMEKFAGYGFNKSHAAGYSLLAYQTAYLKAHYPAEFMAANLTSEMSTTDRIVTLIEECRRMGVPVLPPDINESDADFLVTDGAIRFGLGAVKNVGRNAIQSIVSARRKQGRFPTIFDMALHVDSRLVNRRILESLIQAGAMDSLEGHRAQLMAALDTVVSFAQSSQTIRLRGQRSIFDLGDPDQAQQLYPQPPAVPEWQEREKLSREKELLGFYISGHPLSRYEDEIRSFSSVSLNQLGEAPDGSQAKVCGIITRQKTTYDRNGRLMAFVTLEDFSGSCEVIVFADTFANFRDLLEPDSMVMITGKVSAREDEEAKVLCDDVVRLSLVRDRLSKNIVLEITEEGWSEEDMIAAKKLMRKHRGKMGVYIRLHTENGGDITLRSKSLRVRPAEELLSGLKKVLGRDNVRFQG